MAPNHSPPEGTADHNPGPFVVSHPCRSCDGDGQREGQVCEPCFGTGVGRFYHGTKAELRPGDQIAPGRRPNFGTLERESNFVYCTGTLDAATWGAELALGEGRGHIYVVRPTGALEDDPNLTNTRFSGNPTKSYRSRDSLVVERELRDWQGHAAEDVARMQASLARLKAEGVEPID